MDGFASGEGGEVLEIMVKTFSVYVLQSLKDGRHYIRNTQDIGERIKRHNAGDYRYTKGHRPWRLVYKEVVKSRSEAVKLERFFKSGAGRKTLKKKILDSVNKP